MTMTMADVTTDIIIFLCSLSSMSLGDDKTTKLEHYVIRGCRYLIQLTI